MTGSRWIPCALACALFVLGSAGNAHAGEDERERLVITAEHLVESARRSCTRFEVELVRVPEALRPVMEKRLAVAKERLALSEAALEAAKAGEADLFGEITQQVHAQSQKENVFNQWVHLERRALTHRKAKPGATEREKACRARLLILYAEIRGIYTRFVAGEGAVAPRKVWQQTGPKGQHAGRLENALRLFDEKRRLLEQQKDMPDEALRARFDERLRLQDALIDATVKFAETGAPGEGRAVEELRRGVRRWEGDDRARREIARLQKQTADASPKARALAKEIAACLLQAARLRAEADEKGRDDVEEVLLEGRAEGLEVKAEFLEYALEKRLEMADFAKEAKEAREDALVKAMLLAHTRNLDAYEKAVREVATLAADAAEMAARAEAGEYRLEAFEDKAMFLGDLLDEIVFMVEDAREEAAEFVKDAEEVAELVEDHADALAVFDRDFARLAAAEPELARAVRALLEDARARAEKGLGLLRAGHADEAKGVLAGALQAREYAAFATENLQRRDAVGEKAALRVLGPEEAKLLAAYRKASGASVLSIVRVVRAAFGGGELEEVAAIIAGANEAQAQAETLERRLEAALRKAPLKDPPPPAPVPPVRPVRPVPGPVPDEAEEENIF